MADNERYASVELRLKDYITAQMPKIRKEFQALSGDMVKNEIAAAKVEIAHKRLETASTQTANAQKRLEVTTIQVSNAEMRLEQSTIRTSIAEKRLEIATSQAEAAQKRAEIAAIRLDNAHKKQGNSMKAVVESINAMRNGVLLYMAVRAGQHIYGEATALDSLEYKMKAAVKGYADAGKTMKWVSEEADRIGLRTRTAGEGFAGFAASATRANISMKDTKQIWVDVAETATAMRLPALKVEMVFKAIEQMASKGKISTEELRQQLGEHLPGAFGIAAKSMGMTTQEFDKAVSSGEVYAQDFLPKFARAIREELGGEFESASKGVVANSERMKDRFDAIYRIVGNNLLPSFNSLLSWLAKSDGAFARSTEFVGKYANRLGKLMSGTSFDVVKMSEANQETIKMASQVSRPYAQRMLTGAKRGVESEISATAEAIKNLENAPSVVTPGGNGIDQKAAQMERLKKRAEDLNSELIVLTDALDNIDRPKVDFSGGSGGGGGGSGKEQEKFSDWLENRMEQVRKQKEQERKELLDDIVKKQDEEENFQSWLNSKFEENNQKKIAAQRAFDQSKLALIKDAHDREVAELRLQQNIELEDFKGTEEQKKLILATQLNERDLLEQQSAERRKALNQQVVQSAMDAAQTLGDLAFDTILGNIDVKKEKERAHALTAAQFGMAHGMAAAKIWSTAKDWKEGLAESIGVSVGLFAQEIKAHAEINKYEQGTRYARGGRSLVGEREAEVVDIPVGSRVTPLSKMNQPIGGNTTNLYLQVQDNTGNISRMVLKEMRNGEGDRLTDHIIGLTKRAM